MIILKYGDTNKAANYNRLKVKCQKCGCIMMLDEGDYSILYRENPCYMPYKKTYREYTLYRIKYECAYCQNKADQLVDRYGLWHRVLIQAWNIYVEYRWLVWILAFCASILVLFYVFCKTYCSV